jgi:flavin reductase (DIM6/NTAB) family NADH-FMN oxidoreductase RutF
MFYEPRSGHGLPHDPFKAIVTPRPIGWISTVDEQGRCNLAPYSFFNGISADPPMVAFSSEGLKDTVRNIKATGEFVYNLATAALADQINRSSAPVGPEVDEFRLVGLTPAPSRIVRPPRVAGSPAHMECKLHQLVDLPPDPRNGKRNTMVIGLVVGIHIDDSFVVNGRFDTVRARPIARLGYNDYAVVTEAFEMKRPGWPLP